MIEERDRVGACYLRPGDLILFYATEHGCHDIGPKHLATVLSVDPIDRTLMFYRLRFGFFLDGSFRIEDVSSAPALRIYERFQDVAR